MDKFFNFVKTHLPNKTEKDWKEITEFFLLLPDRKRKFLNYLQFQKDNFNLKKIKIAENIKSKTKYIITLNYDINYISAKYNITKKQAYLLIESFKKNKSTKKENFIKRHGMILGEKKFTEFQKTSAKSTENIKKQLKETNKSWSEYNRERSRRCPEFYLKRNLAISNEEAQKLANEYILKTSGVHKQYYENLKLTVEEISDILSEINKKQGQTKRNRKFLQQKFPDNWKEIYDKHILYYRSRMEELKLWTPIELLEDFQKYKLLCIFYTNESFSLEKEKIKDFDKRSREWHLDHQYSIKHGFLNDVDPKIIGSIVNFKIVPRQYNCQKGSKSDISLKELLKRYENYKNNKN